MPAAVLVKSFILFALPILATATLATAEPGANDTAWKEESTGHGVTIYSRTHPGTSLKEFKAVGEIESASPVVFAVIDDTEAYPTFMPYTVECRILKRDGDQVLTYQRLDLPLVSDRDYTLHSKHERWLGPAGKNYRIHWEAANDLGPARKAGVQRVRFCEGGWLLEPDGAGSTRATYSIFTDSGGALPAFIANNGSRIAIRKIFEAVRQQVKNPKYSSAR